MTSSQANNVIINVFESIQSVNIYKYVWLCDETLVRDVNRRFPTLQGFNIERKNLYSALAKNDQQDFDKLLYHVN